MKGCRPLTDEETKRVAQSFKGRFEKRDRALFLLGVKSGFRISEILSLRLRDLIANDRLLDRVTVQKRYMKKKRQSRSVILNADAKAALADWIDELRAEGVDDDGTYVFRSRNGRNRAIGRVQAYRILEVAFEANGMTGKLGTHSMRKTFANKVYQNLDGDLVKTQQALGHRSINSTVSYLSFRQEEIDSAILAM